MRVCMCVRAHAHADACLYVGVPMWSVSGGQRPALVLVPFVLAHFAF